MTLRANFFAVRLPKGPVYRYTVEITPKKALGERKARIFQLLERSPLCQPHLAYIAHDKSERLVSARKLPQPLDIQVRYVDFDGIDPPADAQVYVVSIKLLDELKTEEMTQCVLYFSNRLSIFTTDRPHHLLGTSTETPRVETMIPCPWYLLLIWFFSSMPRGMVSESALVDSSSLPPTRPRRSGSGLTCISNKDSSSRSDRDLDSSWSMCECFLNFVALGSHQNLEMHA